MTTVELQKVKISLVKPRPGSSCHVWNYDCNGKPFGQIWTYKVRGERHPYHAKVLTGGYRTFNRVADADEFIRGKM